MAHEEFIPVEGRSVVYRLDETEYRPAQIVRVWNTQGSRTCNLVVFVDGSNDLGRGVNKEDALHCVSWRTSVVLGEGVCQYLPRKPVLL